MSKSPLLTRWRRPAVEARELPSKWVAGELDPWLAGALVGLLGLGVVMVFSASASEATVTFKDPFYFLRRQAVYAALGLSVMFGLSRLDYRYFRPLTYLGLFAAVGLLALSLTSFGHSGGGAVRWLRVGPVHVQPSEIAKLALVMWLAYSLEKKRDNVKTFAIGLLPHVLMAGVLMVLCLRQPDFGGAVVLSLLTFLLLFVAGARLIDLAGTCAVAVGAAFWLVRSQDYRWERVLAWQAMDEHRHSLAYQPFQSLMSFGSGELSGLGLGKGLQVLYLPEAHNDFIAAIIGEELGFIGVGCLCLAYLLIVVRGLAAALAAPDAYGAYIAFGVSLLMGIQALINLAVAMALLPTKGLTLPFVSYGGSSLLMSAIACGILLNISRRRRAVEVDDERPEAMGLILGQPAAEPALARPRATEVRA